MFDSFSRRVRWTSASVRGRSRTSAGVFAWAWLLGAAIQTCRERAAAYVCMDVSRGRRGESWQRVNGAGSRDGVVRRRVRLGVATLELSVSRACRHVRVYVAGVGNRGSVRTALERGMAFRVAGVGNGGGCVREEEGGRTCRVVGVGLRMHVGVWEDAGRWIRVAGVVNRVFGRYGTHLAWQVWGMVAIEGRTRALA